MCSFLAANQLISNLAFVNFFLRPRGPDATTHAHFNGFDFVHNLLHMTGERRLQPFLNGDVAVLFNGEIYNWEALSGRLGGHCGSDGEILLPAYRHLGKRFARALDGEFAIALFDFATAEAFFVTDAFGSKPLWYALVPEERRLAVASYKSALLRLGFHAGSVHMVGPNRALTVSLSSFQVLQQAAVIEFDLRQFKRSTDDFAAAFERAVRKRAAGLEATGRPLFVGLSSGFDSGAIHAALDGQAVRHHALALIGEEAVDLLQERSHYARGTSEVSLAMLSQADFEAEWRWLSKYAEPCAYIGSNFTGQRGVLDDLASVGLSYVVRLGRDRGARCYMSGSGADEIISDYGFQGEKLCPQSSFGGLFPHNLSEVFPWSEFFLSTQRDYLAKEEHVAGAHGVEARYPFLDIAVVQEFLWLAPEVKNAEYKAPLHDFLRGRSYPFQPREKQGFAAKANLLKPEEASHVWRYNTLAPFACGLPPLAPGVSAWCTSGQSATGGVQPSCEARCPQNRPPVSDTLRCSHYGVWVGHFVCSLGVGQDHDLLADWPPSLWGMDGPRPPVVIEKG